MEDKLKSKQAKISSLNLQLSSISIFILIAALLLDSLLSDVSTFINKGLSESTRYSYFLLLLELQLLQALMSSETTLTR